jgi:hypothetical protein
LDVQAWVPEDFNLHVDIIEGDITGVNMKDTKLISSAVSLITRGTHSTIQTKRLRNDLCTLKTIDGDVKIDSYIETGLLHLETQGGNIQITKKLGIGKFGKIETQRGRVQIGSVFSNMAKLPE